MHPEVISQLASQHTDELREAAAARYVRHRVPRNSIRYRAGWTMVEIGLRIAGPASGD
jgi:hypothetical protein